MNTEFERNQAIRKGVFVKSKRLAPQPPPRSDENQRLGNNSSIVQQCDKQNDELNYKFNHKESKWITSRAYPSVETTKTCTNQSTTKGNDVIDDDNVSLAMLDQLEKQICRLEFDTKVTPKSSERTAPPTFKKPVHYTGLESLLKTGVSDVATEHGIGYFEKESNDETDDSNNNFIRNANTRQSLGGHGKLVPPVNKPMRPVARTASDTNHMKDVVMTKQAIKRRDVLAVELEKSPISTKLKTVPFREKRPVETNNISQATTITNSRPMPVDVRKYVEARMANKVMVTRLIKLFVSQKNPINSRYGSPLNNLINKVKLRFYSK